MIDMTTAEWLPGALLLSSQVFVFLSHLVAARDAAKTAAGLRASPAVEPPPAGAVD